MLTMQLLVIGVVLILRIHSSKPSRVRCADHFLFAGFNNWGHTFAGHCWLVSSVSSEFFGCLLIHRKAGSRPSLLFCYLASSASCQKTGRHPNRCWTSQHWHSRDHKHRSRRIRKWSAQRTLLGLVNNFSPRRHNPVLSLRHKSMGFDQFHSTSGT